ncbi:MAG: 16S rRNA (cytosine(1402)-N(4))-methyltransferase RsmH [Sphingomonadaceae bacterium]
MSGHVPVLLAEVLAALAPGPGHHLVDGTFGGGGYAAAFLESGAIVTAFDRDLRSLAAGAALVARAGGRLRLVNRSFADMADELGAACADGVALDLGYSSIQLDDPSYGLSFQADGPLDMRLSGHGPTAADFLNSASEAEIADVLFHYGEEPAARRIARAVVAARPLATTADFAAVVRRAVKAPPGSRRDPATRSFQAVRIHVNDELAELERGLVAAEAVLKPGGALAVVSFHSLEDRIVKRFLAERGGAQPAGSRHLPAAAPRARPSFERPARPRRPSERELAANPRARSATLRVARRSAAPAWGARNGGRAGFGMLAAGHGGGRA